MKKYFKNASALLLSFLVMTALLSSVLYIARISLRQITQSKSVDNANIAFYAAESGNEQAIYYLRKKTVNDIADLNASLLNSIGSFIIRTVTSSVDDINIALNQDENFQLDMNDKDGIANPSNVSYLEISWSDRCGNGSWLELTSTEWDLSNFVWGGIDNPSMLNHVKKSLLNEFSYTKLNNNEITMIGGSNIDPNKTYQFRIKALFCDVYDLKISAFNSSDIKIPFKNIYNIESIGQHPGNSTKGNRQALSISLRSVDPLSGLFDYVIFSEEDLVKDSGIYVGNPDEDPYIGEVSPLYLSVGNNVNHAISIVNGVEPFTWSYTGTLPDGLSFSNGILVGTPTTTETSIINFQAIDSSTPTPKTASKAITIIVSE